MQPTAAHRKRQRYKKEFLMEAGWLEAQAQFLAGDASNRHYERLHLKEGGSTVLMDAPDSPDPLHSFIHIAELLYNCGFSTPEILAADTKKGFLLLEDLGDLTFNKALRNNNSPQDLYKHLVDLILEIHKIKANLSNVPPFIWEDFATELDIFCQWAAPAFLNRSLTSSEQEDFYHVWQESYSHLPPLPSVLILRDCHIDNFMWLPERAGLAKVGILDFQDARIGSPAYDLVSLLEDARYDVMPSIQEEMREYFIENNPSMKREDFLCHYGWMGAQRSTKILGIFTRLAFKFGKRQYLTHIPRVWNWLDQDFQHPNLLKVKGWFDKVFPSKVRYKVPSNLSLICDAHP